MTHAQPEYATCRSCGAEIYWLTTKAGRRIPVDVHPTHTGNIVLDDLGTARHVGKNESNRFTRYQSHFSSCPQADRWRRKP